MLFLLLVASVFGELFDCVESYAGGYVLDNGVNKCCTNLGFKEDSYDPTKKSCQEECYASLGCKTCDPVTLKCTACLKAGYVPSHLGCIPERNSAIKIEGCDYGAQTEDFYNCPKDSCADGYYWKDNDCYYCPSPCAQCTYLEASSEVKCSAPSTNKEYQCLHNYLPVVGTPPAPGSAYVGECVCPHGGEEPIPAYLKYCRSPSSHSYCDDCCDGYYLKPSEGTCHSCETEGELAGCKICYFDTTKVTAVCMECANPTSSTKDSEEGSWSITLQGGVCKEVSNCVRGTRFGCAECSEGFVLVGDECRSCETPCKICHGEPSKCILCNDGFVFEYDKAALIEAFKEQPVVLPESYRCIDKPANCKKADQFGCVECDEQYFLNSVDPAVPHKSICEQCQAGCAMCNNSADDCTACEDFYILESVGGSEKQTCVKLDDSDSHCKSADMGFCVECEDLYFLNPSEKSTCNKCNESCDSCLQETSCIHCKENYWRPKKQNNDGICYSYNVLDNCLSPTPSGCSQCFDGYYANEDGYCEECFDATYNVPNCRQCVKGENDERAVCENCHEGYIFRNGKCISCVSIEHCIFCSEKGCEACEDGYSTNTERDGCEKLPLELIVPLAIVGVLIILIIIAIVTILLWRRKVAKDKLKAVLIRPQKVPNEVQLQLLAANNALFPLKTEKWDLDFGLQRTKAVIDHEYKEVLNIANLTKSSYYFEIISTPSHRYKLEWEPQRYTLKPQMMIPVTFKLTMLCTAIVNEEIGIVCMDMEDQNKQAAVITITVESDLSMKLDHTELIAQMPPIGEGAFGMVFRGTYRQQEVAIKKMKARNLTEEQEKEFTHEVQMLTQLRHQTVVNLIGAVYTEGEIAIVTEFAEFGSLSKLYKKQNLQYDLKVKFMDDAAVALDYLHRNTIIHRDVKGENLLVYSLNPNSIVCAKLTDFGTCRNINERAIAAKELTQGIGTPTYMAPEALSNSPYSYPLDVYSYAIVMYETFIENGAYDDRPDFDQPWTIPQFVIEGQRLPKPEGMPDAYWKLVEQCWDHEASKRPTFAQILEQINSWVDVKINHAGGDRKDDKQADEEEYDEEEEGEEEVEEPEEEVEEGQEEEGEEEEEEEEEE